MDKQTDDCPCKKLRVSDDNIDAETGVSVCSVQGQSLTNYGDSGQSQQGGVARYEDSSQSELGEASIDPFTLKDSDSEIPSANSRGDSRRTTLATQNGYWDFGYEASCEISDCKHDAETESRSSNQSLINPRNDYHKLNKNLEPPRAESEDVDDIAGQHLETNSELLKLELFTGPKFDLLHKDTNVAEGTKETHSDEKDSKSNEVKKRTDLKRSVPNNYGICEYVQNVQTVTENMHLKSREDKNLVSSISIKETIKSRSGNSPRKSENLSDDEPEELEEEQIKNDDNHIVLPEKVKLDGINTSNEEPDEKSTLLHNLLGQSSHQVHRKIPSKTANENPPSNDTPSLQGGLPLAVPSSCSSDASNADDKVEGHVNVAHKRMVDSGFIEMFTNSVMNSVFSSSNALGGVSGSSSKPRSSNSLSTECGFSGLSNVLDDMRYGLSRSSSSNISDSSTSATSSHFVASNSSALLSSIDASCCIDASRDGSSSLPAMFSSNESGEKDNPGDSACLSVEQSVDALENDTEICDRCCKRTEPSQALNEDFDLERGKNLKQRNRSFVLSNEYKNRVTSESCINSLPPSLLLQIFKHMTVYDLLRYVGLVCKYWYNLCRDPDLWRNVNLASQDRLEDNDLRTILQYSDHRARYINLTDCRFLSNIGIGYLLAMCTQIEVLKIIRCSDVTDVAFAAFQSCRSLSSLYLDGNSRLTDDTVKKVSECCPQLRCLHLNHCTKVTNSGVIALARNCPHLVELQLNHCCMVSDIAMSEIVAGCPNITCLHLMSCGISDTGVKYLSELSQLSNLDLSHIPRLTADSVIYLSKFCSKLSSINLSLNGNIEDHSISEAVRNLPELKRLYCVSCNLADKGLEDIAKYCPKLEALDVGWCQGVTDDGIRVVSLSCKHLEYFGLFRCDRVTIETIEELELAHPKINYSTFILESRRLLETARKEGYSFELT